MAALPGLRELLLIGFLFLICTFVPSQMAMKRLSQLDLLALDAAGLQRQLDAGLLTSETLVQECLAQIDRHEQRGAKLNAMISVVPEHILRARSMQLDQERASGSVRSPFHGIPILVKVRRLGRFPNSI